MVKVKKQCTEVTQWTWLGTEFQQLIGQQAYEKACALLLHWGLKSLKSH